MSANHFIVCTSNLVMNYDFSHLMAFHREVEADITFLSRPDRKPSAFQDVEIRRDGRLLIRNRPSQADSWPLYEVFVARKSFLLSMVRQSAAGKSIWNTLATDALGARTYAYPAKGYIGSITSPSLYYEQHLRLLDPATWEEIFCQPYGVTTRDRDLPPAKYYEDGGATASIVANGCLIGGQVKGSVLFPEVRVNREASINDSVIMENCEIGRGATVECAVLPDGTRVAPGQVIRGDRTNPLFLE